MKTSTAETVSIWHALFARRDDRVLWAIIGVSIVLGLIYNAVILIGFGPDEPRHMAYVKLLAEEHIFPFILPDGNEYKGAHSLHPPLYYVLLVPLYWLAHSWPADAVWHLARVFSLLLRAVRQSDPHQPAVMPSSGARSGVASPGPQRAGAACWRH